MAIKNYPEIRHEGNGGNIDDKSPAALGIEWEGQPGPRNLRNQKISAFNNYSNNLHQALKEPIQASNKRLKQLRDIVYKESTDSVLDTLRLKTHLRLAGNDICKYVDQARTVALTVTKNYINEQNIGKIPKRINLNTLCYDEDVNKLHKRIQKIFDAYGKQSQQEKDFRPDTMMYSLFGIVLRIIDTESMYVCNHVLALVDSGEAQWGEYVSGENCTNSHQICDQYCNGIHTLATLRAHIPPFHTNCHCFPIFYSINELNDNNKEENKE